jgi:zinc protease
MPRIVTSPRVLAFVVAIAACERGGSKPPEPGPEPALVGETPAQKAEARDQKAQEAAAKRAQLAALPPLPGVTPPRPVKFPEPQVQTLANGLELVVLEDHEVPRVRVSVIVKAGEIYAPVDSPSLAEFTVMLLAEGTTKRDKATFDAQVDATGGDVGSAVDDEAANITADVLARDAAFAFTAVAEQVMTPGDAREPRQKIKDQLLQGVDVEKSSPFGLSARMAARAIYGEESPYGRPFPTTAQIEGMTREQALAFHAKHYLPGNAMLVVAGTSSRRRRASSRTGRSPGGRASRGAGAAAKRPAPVAGSVVYIVDRKASAQASVLALVPAPGIGEPGWLQIRVLEQALGGGLSGRLNHGAARAAGADLRRGRVPQLRLRRRGLLRRRQHQDQERGRVHRGAARPAAEPGKEAVDAVELRRLLSKISGQFALEVEGIDTVAMKTVQQRLFGLAPDFWEKYRSEVESISAESCSRPAQPARRPGRAPRGGRPRRQAEEGARGLRRGPRLRSRPQARRVGGSHAAAAARRSPRWRAVLASASGGGGSIVSIAARAIDF